MNSYTLRSDSIQKLFDSIAPTYDLLNRLLSLGIDAYWRKVAVRELKGIEGLILDLATGTGDVAIEIIRQNRLSTKVIGLDFSEAMVRRGQEKILRKGLSHSILLSRGDALALPFRENSLGASIIAFGLRNIPDKERALSEMVRVIRKGGKIVVLEFTHPQKKWIRKLYLFYFQKLLPWFGGMISGDRGAYTYFPESVSRFSQANAYEEILRRSGVEGIHSRALTFGIASIISGTKGHL